MNLSMRWCWWCPQLIFPASLTISRLGAAGMQTCLWSGTEWYQQWHLHQNNSAMGFAVQPSDSVFPSFQWFHELPNICFNKLPFILGYPGGAGGKEPTCQCSRCKTWGFSPWVGKISWRRKLPTPVFLPEESHGQRSLVRYGPWGCQVSLTQLKRHRPFFLNQTIVLVTKTLGWYHINNSQGK